MKKILRILLGILLFATPVAGYGLYRYGPNFNVWLFPPSAKRYGEYAINRIDMLGLYASGEEWQKAKSTALSELERTKSYDETYPIIEKALAVAGGKHSHLLTKEQGAEWSAKNTAPSIDVLENGILYLKVPSFSPIDDKDAEHYANVINNALASESYRAVILDLQGNGGGDMSPMLTGVSSLLPDGELLHFEDKYGNQTALFLTGNQLSSSAISLEKETAKKSIPIAVLIDEGTGSSGEITAMSFQGLDNVRFFGESTAAYTTGNVTLPLYDGASLILTNLKLINRLGTTYENQPILPDVETTQAKEKATKWLIEETN